MNQDFTPIDILFTRSLGKTFPAALVVIRIRGTTIYSRAFGFLDPETKSQPVNLTTRFDLASVSKLYTVAAFMTYVEESHVRLDQRVCDILPEFIGERPIAPYPDPLHPGELIKVAPPDSPRPDARQVTFRHLLAHNSGLPAWLPLYQRGSRAEMRSTALSTPFAYPTGTHVVYSDIGLILLGFALEKIARQPLDEIIRERVTGPLGLSSITYGPINCDNVAPTEFYVRLGKRMCGEVHDENAWGFGGIAGHAGLFGTARDVAALGEMFRRHGAPLLKSATIAEMTRLQSQEGATGRGIGFLLWSPDPTAPSHPLSEKSFGHFGFTGTSLWIDPTRELVAVCLTNRVYYGRNNADALSAFRLAFHRTVCEIIDD